MNRLFLLILLLGYSLCVNAQKSEDIVHVKGSKYYVHLVKKGDTLYSLFKLYEVSESTVVKHNPQLVNGLKVGDKLKIPVVEVQEKKISKRKLRRTYDKHVVSRGETLYAISRMYSIPISTITDDNRQIDPIYLQLGETILIRKDSVGTESEYESKLEWIEYNSDLNSVADIDEAYHIVKMGETFYSLARRFEISEEKLSAINNGLKAHELRFAAIIKIPKSSRVLREEVKNIGGEIELGQDIDFTQTVDVYQFIDFKAIDKGDKINVALLLPMSQNGTPNSSYLEFYQGFLLGLDSVRHKYGHSVNVTLFDTMAGTNEIRDIVNSTEFMEADLIVGPIYENQLSIVVDAAERMAVPVVSPLANISVESSDVLFQMAPAPATKQSKIVSMLTGENVHVTLIYTEENDVNFEQEILALLDSTKYSKYNYSHSRDEVIGTTSTDLTPILIDEVENVFVIMSSNEIEVDRILAGISSAYTNIVSRGRTAPKYSIVGNARWSRYQNIDRTIFFKNNISFISTYHAKRDSETIVSLDSNYVESFSSLPTMFSYRGYDAAMIFVPAMYGEIESGMGSISYAPLQTTYVFNQVEGSLNHVNQNWTKVNYNRNFTITLE